jgi:hypothetical protein
MFSMLFDPEDGGNMFLQKKPTNFNQATQRLAPEHKTVRSHLRSMIVDDCDHGTPDISYNFKGVIRKLKKQIGDTGC